MNQRGKRAGKSPATSARGPLRPAWAFYAAGRLDEASRAAQAHMGGANAAAALHLLGVIALAQGEAARALPLLSEAAERNPDVADLQNDLGEAQRACGDLQTAEVSYRRALALQPRNSSAQNNLGLALAARGALAEAEKAFRAALSLDARFGEAAMNLANLLRESGDVDGALRAYRVALRAPRTAAAAGLSIGGVGLARGDAVLAREGFASLLRSSPGLPRAELGMALAEEMEGDNPAALRRLRKLLQRESEEAAAWVARGRTALRLRLHAEAVEAYERALALSPEDEEARLGRVRALLEDGRLAEAERACRDRLSAGDDAPLLGLLGDALAMQGKPEEAERALRRALALRPDNADALSRLGELQAQTGELDEAARRFREALTARPDHAIAWENLCALPARLLEPEADIARLQAAITAARSASPGTAAQLRFAAARLLETAGRYAEAEEEMFEANARMAELAPFDVRAHAALVEQLLGTVDRPLIDRLAGSSGDRRRMLFIVGMPRSGTTLLEQMLSRLPGVFAAGELPFFGQLRVNLAGESYPASLRHLDAAGVAEIAARYARALDAPSGTRLAVDKMPANFLHAGLIAGVLPNARFIWMQRRREDVALSVFQQNFTYAEGNAWTFSLEHIARVQADCDRLMAHWQCLLGERVMPVPYEELVADPEASMRRVLQHARLPWDAACLDFAGSRRRVLTASVAQVREPINRRSVGRAARFPRVLRQLHAAYEALATRPV